MKSVVLLEASQPVRLNLSNLCLTLITKCVTLQTAIAIHKSTSICTHMSLNDLEQIKGAAKLLLSDQILKEYTDHSFAHSDRMYSKFFCKIKGDLESKGKGLNICEEYILSTAIYLHDCGMQMVGRPILKAFINHYSDIRRILKLVPQEPCEYSAIDLDTISDHSANNFVRKYHHLLSAFWIFVNIGSITLHDNELKDFPPNEVYPRNCDKRLGELCAHVIASHGEDTIITKYDNNDMPIAYCGYQIRMKLLCALLCLIDSLDCDERRIPAHLYNLIDPTKESKFHWAKHYYTSSVIIENNIINISYVFPDRLTPYESNVYYKFFSHETEYWIRENLERHSSLLDKNGLSYKVYSNLDNSSVSRYLSKDTFAYLEQKLAELEEKSANASICKIDIGICIHNNKVVMAERKNKEGDLSWGFPAVQQKDGTEDEQRSRLVKHFEDETGISCHIGNLIAKRIHPDTKKLCSYWTLYYRSGELENLDKNENAQVSWVPLSEYKTKITSSLSYRLEQYLDSNIGAESPQEDTDSISCGVVVKDKKKVLLVKRARSEGDLIWAFPGGKVIINETSSDAVVREIREETSIISEAECLLGSRTHPQSKRHISYWKCRYISGEPTDNCNEAISGAEWVDIANLQDYITTDIYIKVKEYLQSVKED